MEDMADFAISLALKKGAKFAEARIEKGFGDYFMLKNGNLDISAFDRFSGISVRLIVDGALGFGTTSKVDNKAAVKDLVEGCVKLAKTSTKIMKNRIEFSEEKSSADRYEVKQRKNLADISQEEKMTALMDIEKNLPKNVMIPGRLFFLQNELREKYYTNSEGCKISSKIPKISTGFYITVAENNQTEQAMLGYGKSMGWEFVDDMELSKRVNHEAEILQRMIKEGKKAPKEKLDIICGPEVVGIAVHESCGHPYEADRIMGREAAQAGESFVTINMLGQKIGNEVVTVIDDPTVPGGYGFYLYDDEGVKARARNLILNGKINEFLHNRATAASMGIKSNGSARANNYDREPIVRMGNTFMKPGDFSFEELVEGIKRGVYINSFTEWNIDDKRYNQKYVGREAYMIEGGEIKGAIRRPVLELTTPGFYSAVDAVGEDIERNSATCGKGEPAQGIPVDHGGPHIRLRGIPLGG